MSHNDTCTEISTQNQAILSRGNYSFFGLPQNGLNFPAFLMDAVVNKFDLRGGEGKVPRHYITICNGFIKLHS